MTVEAEAFRGFPYAILAFEGNRHLLAWNVKARDLLGPLEAGTTCCELLSCGTPAGPPDGGCFTELAQSREAPLPEVRVDLSERADAPAAWVTAARLREDGSRIVIQVRPGEARDRRRRTESHWAGRPELTIEALGRMMVRGREGSLSGRWLEQRPGQLLKYLVSERRRVVQSDEIANAMWQDADASAASSVRYFIHALRQHIEPVRARGADFSFVVSRHGGYALNSDLVTVDADVFDEHVRAGITAFRRSDLATAAHRLDKAIALYRGDFLSEDRYSEWALAERGRLHKLASDAVRTLMTIRMQTEDFDDALICGRRLADLEPFDTDVHRNLIALMLRGGRRSDAVRHYGALRKRMLQQFAEEPEFALTEVRASESDVLR